jgi:hypothetical protein
MSRDAVKILRLLLLVFACLVAPAAAQDLTNLSPPEMIKALGDEVAALKKTEAALDANGKTAAASAAALEALNRESARLSAEASAHNAEVEAHNRDVSAYAADCLGRKLPEDEYAACYSRKSALDSGKAMLDAAGEALAKAHAAQNQKVAAFNRDEAGRTAAASTLLAAFRASDEKIRLIEVKLYELAAARGDAAFAEQNRQCTTQGALEAMRSCFEGLWR